MSDLGIHAEFATTCPTDIARWDALKRRFALQSVARRILGPGWRISHCLRTPINAAVDLRYRPDVVRADFGGLQRCASPHVCPCCAATISHRRAAEIDTAVSLWELQGGMVLLSTFTLQHTALEPLATVADRLLASFRRLRSGRQWSLFAARFGLLGSVKAVEYTHGASGWHPHLHVIWFTSALSRSQQRAFAAWLRSRWTALVATHGGYAHELVGCDTRAAGTGSVALGGYLTKLGNAWTVGDEVARANRKQSRAAGGMTPPMLLACAGDGDLSAARLFSEYAHYTHGRDSLRWSRGLRERLQMSTEVTDSDLVAGDLLGSVVVLTLHDTAWRLLLQSPRVGRAELLAQCERLRGDSHALTMWLSRHGIVLDVETLMLSA